MIGKLTGGERRGEVMADLAIGAARAKIPDLSMALEGRFTGHHALMCRLQTDRIRSYKAAVKDPGKRIAARAAPWQREKGLLKTIPGEWLDGAARPLARVLDKLTPAGQEAFLKAMDLLETELRSQDTGN